MTLTSLLLRQWRLVLKRAFRLTPRGPTPALQLTTGPTGMVLRAHAADTFLEFRHSEPQPAQQIALPFAVIADLQGPRRDPVTLEVVNPAFWKPAGKNKAFRTSGSIPLGPRHRRLLSPECPPRWRPIRRPF